jgi:hypothetical protein
MSQRSYRFKRRNRGVVPAELDNPVPWVWHLRREEPEVTTPAAGETGVSGVVNLSSDFYDDLALCTSLLDVGQRFGGRLEWKDAVDDGTDSTRVDE